MTTLREAAQQALEALEYDGLLKKRQAIAALRAALAQQDEPVQEPVAWYQKRGQEVLTSHPACWGREDEPWTPLYTAPPQRQPQTIDEAMQQPRALAQAYENGYKAGVATEREECARVCEARFVGDLNREDMEARRCAAAIRARGVQP